MDTLSLKLKQNSGIAGNVVEMFVLELNQNLFLSSKYVGIFIYNIFTMIENVYQKKIKMEDRSSDF